MAAIFSQADLLASGTNQGPPKNRAAACWSCLARRESVETPNGKAANGWKTGQTRDHRLVRSERLSVGFGEVSERVCLLW